MADTPTKQKKVRKQKQQRLYPEDFDGVNQPQRLWKPRRFGNKTYTLKNKEEVKGVLHLPGRGSSTPKIVFISPCAFPEEVNAGFASKPGVLRGPAANLFLRCIRRLGFKDEDWYYTTLCKYLVPKFKPKAPDIRWNEAILQDELKQFKPKIIVCLGKPAFDHLIKIKFKLKDIQGGFFRSEEYNCLVFPMDSIVTPLFKPESLERFMVDLRELKREFDSLSDAAVVRIAPNYATIKTAEELSNLMTDLKNRLDQGTMHTMAVDCEWSGQTAWSGTLRSLQMCWRAGSAAYIRLTAPQDGKSVYVMDRPLAEIRPILEPLRDPRLKFVGHNIAADAAWMEEHLDIPMYQRVAFDTMFAQHCINEYADLKLERCAVKYTDLGRYDIPLLIWKKKNKDAGDVEDGYGLIPDDIIVPYACLRKESLVQLADGSWEQIHRLVKSKYSGDVKAFLDGRLQNCPVVGWLRRAVDQEDWFQLETASSKYGRWGIRGPVFTPDHKLITRRGRVEVKDIVPGQDAILTDEREFSSEQLSVFLGCLLGDGGFTEKNTNGTGFRFSQVMRRAAYADWKAEVFSSVCDLKPRVTNARHRCYDLPFGKYFKYLKGIWDRHSSMDHVYRKAIITKELLDGLGLLGLAVWYQDDGVYTKDGACRIACTKLEQGEKDLVLAWLRNLFGNTIRYDEIQGCIMFSVSASRRLLPALAPFMHSDFSYKTFCELRAPYKVVPATQPFYEIIQRVLPARKSTNRGAGVRYCLTVDKAGNFLTEAGFVSNCRDVDATYRVYPKLLKQLQQQNLLTYYNTICLPFVSDGFMEMMRCGLPMDLEYLDKMRATFGRNREILNTDFRVDLYKEACAYLYQALCAIDQPQGESIYFDLVDAAKDGDVAGVDRIFDDLKGFVGATGMSKMLPIYLHWREAQQFNIDSTDQMKRWLFDVKGFEPLKTTKRDGIQMAWERVKSLPASRQLEFTPAADKQTIKVLAGKDPLVARVEELKLVGNIVKAFLGGLVDEDNRGDVRPQEGLFKWVQPDGKVHCNFSLTETARPRTWKPNVLNWPKAIAKPIEKSFTRINKRLALAKFNEIRWNGWPTAEVRKQVKEQMIALTSVRSATTAPEGYVIIDSDLKTAEVVVLAYVAGDDGMIRVLTEPDLQFARTDEKDPKKVLRVAYNEISNYPQDQWDERLLVPRDDPRFIRDIGGNLIQPKRDVHWEMGERIQGMPREKCDEERVRGAGKIAIFSVPYGSAEANLERLVEANTGIKPEPGTGAKMLEAYQTSYPVAWRFLEHMEQTVENPGWYRSVSGRVRHFHFNNLSDIDGLSEYARKGILSPLTRQARNFPIQELVAATTAKALIRFIKERNERGMRSQVMSLLYDAMSILAPLEEAKEVALLVKNCMTVWTPWTIGDITFNFDVDTAYNYRWGVKMTKKEKQEFEKYII